MCHLINALKVEAREKGVLFVKHQELKCSKRFWGENKYLNREVI